MMSERLSARGSEGRHFGRFVSQVYWRSQAWLSREMRAFGLSARGYPVLLSLCHGDGRTQEELARNIGVDKAAIKRAVDELVEAGFAVRTEHESDRRAWRVRLTAKSRAIEPDIEGVLDDWEGRLLATLSESDRAMAKSLLAKIADNAAAEASSTET